MVKIITEINVTDQKFNMTVESESTLVSDHFSSLKGMLLNDSTSPSGINVDLIGKNSAIITFPIRGGIIRKSETMAAVSDSATEEVNKVAKIVYRFIQAYVKSRFSTTEFLPILDFSGGYSFEEAQHDALTAVEKKRDILVIDTYESYKKQTESMSCQFNQYLLKWGTSDYVDFVLLMRRGDLKQIRKTYGPRLKKFTWY